MLCRVKFRDGWYFYAQAWASEDGIAWTEICNTTTSSTYPGEGVDGIFDWYFLISQSFRYVRVGSDDVSNRSAYIDLISIVGSDNIEIAGSSASAEGNVVGSPSDALVEDGTGVAFNHTGGDPVDAIEVDFGEVRAALGAWPVTLTPVADRRYGFYSFMYTSSDPAVTPNNWVPNAAEVAVYDFIMSTGGSSEFHNEVKAINPACEIIYRLLPTPEIALDYYADVGTTRADANAVVVNQAATRAGSFDALCLNEEEYFYQFFAALAYPSPSYLVAYEAQVLTDTGVDLTDPAWAGTVSNVNAVRDWLEIRGRFYYQSLYDALKAVYPSTPIYQYMVGSTWAWTIPQDISAEGWVEYPGETTRYGHHQTLDYFGTDYYAVRPDILPIDQTFYYTQVAGMSVTRQLGYIDSAHVDTVAADLIGYCATAGTRQFMLFYYAGILPTDTADEAGYAAWAAANPVNAAIWEKSYTDRVYVEGLIAARNAAAMQTMASGSYSKLVRS